MEQRPDWQSCCHYYHLRDLAILAPWPFHHESCNREQGNRRSGFPYPRLGLSTRLLDAGLAPKQHVLERFLRDGRLGLLRH
jgi:hypothetical protein